MKASRSRGGAASLASITEREFKRRLTASALTGHRTTYQDSNGNLLRSLLELEVATALRNNTIPYTAEKRLVVAWHAYYPDFTLGDSQGIVEVVGFAAAWYWDKTAEKITLIVRDRDVQVAVVSRFTARMKCRLEGVPNVAFFTPYQLDRLVDWCRGYAGVHNTM